MRALGRSRQRSELRINLQQELVEFAKVEGTGFILVVFLEEPVQAAEVVGGLREALFDARGHLAPLAEGDVQFFRVVAAFVGDGAEEVDEVVGDVVLDCGTVADGVDGA